MNGLPKKHLLRSAGSLFTCLVLLGGCSGTDRPGPVPSPERDYQGLAEPAQPYGTLVERVAAFLMSDKGKGGIREDQGHPVPPYFYSFGICDRGDESFTCEAADDLTLPVSFPAYTFSVAADAFCRYYVYSGNPEALDRAREFAEWMLRHLTPETDALARFPYSSQAFGQMGEGGAGEGSIELDKAALFGLGLLALYDITADPRFSGAAEEIAARLLPLQKPDGSWNYRVFPATGEIFQEYTSDQIPLVRLMDRMFRQTGNPAFRDAGDRAWAWLLGNPVRTGTWVNFYEDMNDPESLVNVDALETVRELVARAPLHPEYLDLARSTFQWVEDLFLLVDSPYPPMIPSIAEQTGFRSEDGILAGTCSSTAQWASVSLDVHRALGEERVLRHGIEAANVAVSAQQTDGRMYTVTADANGAGLYAITWYEQCFVPLARVLEIMGRRPETAPEGETHMLSYSAPVQEIVYEPRSVRYRTSGPGTEVLKVSGPVQGVVAGDVAVFVHRARAGEADWEYDPETGLLRVSHDLPAVTVTLEE
jgi:hypothetical protein